VQIALSFTNNHELEIQTRSLEPILQDIEKRTWSFVHAKYWWISDDSCCGIAAFSWRIKSVSSVTSTFASFFIFILFPSNDCVGCICISLTADLTSRKLDCSTSIFWFKGVGMFSTARLLSTTSRFAGLYVCGKLDSGTCRCWSRH
jgi:hypothetical protein